MEENREIKISLSINSYNSYCNNGIFYLQALQ